MATHEYGLETIPEKDLPLPCAWTKPAAVVAASRLRDLRRVEGDAGCSNFDDQCPVSHDHLGRDFGGDPTHGLAVKFKTFLEECPYVAVTSFVVPHYLGSKKGNEKSKLSHHSNQDWLSFYNDLSGQFNIEYALHGCYHYQKENPFFARHTEFAFKDENESLVTIHRGMQIFDECGWQVSGFRQPGWDINSDISICRVLNKLGVNYIAGSSLDAGFNSGGFERVSNYYPTLINGLINFPQNIELSWKFERIISEIDRLYELRALISIKGHFVDKDMRNCLSQNNIEKLTKLARYIRDKYKDSIEFTTFADLAKKYTKSFEHGDLY